MGSCMSGLCNFSRCLEMIQFVFVWLLANVITPEKVYQRFAVLEKAITISIAIMVQTFAGSDLSATETICRSSCSF